MAKRLTRTVFVGGVAYGPSSAIPAAVAAKITNPKVWADDDGPPEAASGAIGNDSSGTAPAGADIPVPDAEATVKELRDYAKAQGVVLGAAKTKPEILQVLGLGDAPAEDDQEDGDLDEVPEADSAEDITERPADDADGADGQVDGTDSE